MKVRAPFYFERVKRTSYLYEWGVRYLLFGRAIGRESIAHPNKAQGRTNATFFGVEVSK